MQLIRHFPCAALSRHVERFWFSRRAHAQEYGEHALPSGNIQMIFLLHEASILCLPQPDSRPPLRWSRSIVHGPQWRHFQSGAKPAGVTVGVCFHPGGAEAILGVPATELTDRHVPLEQLWGVRAEEMRERLAHADEPAAVFRVLEAQLLARLKHPLSIHPAVTHALNTRPGGWAHVRVADVQREAGLSHRHFVSLFRAAVGLTPKHYYRIKRFNIALQRLAAEHRSGLTDIALAAGYCDQAHLSREFREFAGTTPGEYRPRDSTSFLHHRAHDALAESAARVRIIQDSGAGR